MFEREFYPLSELAERWGCTVGDLLHLGIQDRAQICVNIYGLATGTSRTRMQDEAEDVGQEIEPQTEDERREAAEMDAAFEAWQKRTTRNMPHGIFELQSDAVRFVDMPSGLPFELHEAMKFDDGWWHVDFGPPVTIDLGHLVMLQEEVERLDRERRKSTATKSLPTDNSMLGTIAALMAAWPGGRLPSGKDLEKSAASVGVAITDDTIRKALAAARTVAKGLPPA